MSPIADPTAAHLRRDPDLVPDEPEEREPAVSGSLEAAATAAPAGEGTAEPVDAVPVLAEARTLAPSVGALPAVQAAAVAATGFFAGAATLALVRRHTARRHARSGPVRGRAIDALPIVGSRTFVVDVHLLAKPGE